MPFGFITQRQLDQHASELRNEVRRTQDMLEEWYDKFQRLYARLSKRVKDAEAVDTETDAAAASAERPSDGNAAPPRIITPFRRSMRGF